jgi:phospholipid/cholesterol/gamma-HCH transport system permease protein
MRLLALLGRTGLNLVSHVGRMTIFAAMGVSHWARPPFFLRQFGRQVIDIGFFSLPVVGLTALFTGMVLALQSYQGFADFQAEEAVASIVVISMARELGPVLAGLMVAGRIGAAMSAEIGTMRVTEQIDALTTSATNPYKYLVAPRLMAGTLMMPVLVMVANSIGIFGGFVVAVAALDFTPSGFLNSAWRFADASDVLVGLLKAAVYGFIIALSGCYHGFYSRGGAQGVGQATTNAVVTASVLILLFNYVITEVFFSR